MIDTLWSEWAEVRVLLDVGTVTATTDGDDFERPDALTLGPRWTPRGASVWGISAGRAYPSSGVALSADSFNRPDSTAGIGATDGAGSFDPAAWTQWAPTIIGISGNAANNPNPFAGSYAKATLDLGTADVDLKVTVGTNGAYVGICFRLTDNNNYFWFRSTSSSCELYKKVAGADVLVTSGSGGTFGGDVMEVVCSGSSIVCKINGVTKITQTDTFNQTATRHGVWCEGNVTGLSSVPRVDAWSATGVATIGTLTAATIDAGSSDADVTVVVGQVGTMGGLVARWAGGDFLYLGASGAAGSDLVLSKFVGGTPTTIHAFTGTPVNNGDALRLDLEGNSLAVWRNGVNLGTYSDPLNATSTLVGIHGESSTYIGSIAFTVTKAGTDPTFTLDDPILGQLDYGVLDSPTAPYIDVTCDVRTIDYGWGATRNDGVLTRWEAASGSLVLDNNEGQYDVGTETSPLVPMIGVLVQARLAGSSTWVTRSSGYANTFAAGWDAGTLDATTVVSYSDATGLLSAYVMQPTTPVVGAGDTSSQRVARILDAAEWRGARDLDAGGRVLAATDLSGDAWAQLLEVDDAELGAIYIAPDGTATFRTREHVWGTITATTAPSVTFGPDAAAGELRYEDATVAVDDALLRNIVDAQRPGGALYSVRDAASVSRYLPHRYANTQLALATDGDVQAWASMVLNVSTVPFSRVDALVVVPRTDPANLFPVVLGARYLDRWHVVVDPPGNADEIDRDVLVRGWHTTIDREDWQTTYALSSLAGFDAFILDDPDTMLDVVRLTA